MKLIIIGSILLLLSCAKKEAEAAYEEPKEAMPKEMVADSAAVDSNAMMEKDEAADDSSED